MKEMRQARPYDVREQDRVLIAECPFCGASMPITLGLRAGQGKKTCPCGAALHGSGLAEKLVELKLTGKERRALRLFRDHPDAAVRVHALTRHTLERKGLLRSRKLTALGRAALAPPSDVPNIFDDLFPSKKAAR